MAADITRVRLPHTGLRVPDKTLHITGLKQREGPDSVAFEAVLRRLDTEIAKVCNQGHGGPTCTTATPEVLAELDAYAKLCLTEEGDPVPALEDLIDALVDEHALAGKVAKLLDAGLLPMRLMEHVVFDGDEVLAGFPPRPTGWAAANRPTQPKEWKAIKQRVAERRTPPPYAWWQAWTRNGWRDLTRRPARVPAHLYV